MRATLLLALLSVFVVAAFCVVLRRKPFDRVYEGIPAVGMVLTLHGQTYSNFHFDLSNPNADDSVMQYGLWEPEVGNEEVVTKGT